MIKIPLIFFLIHRNAVSFVNLNFFLISSENVLFYLNSHLHPRLVHIGQIRSHLRLRYCLPVRRRVVSHSLEVKESFKNHVDE